MIVDDGALSYTGSGKSLIGLRGSDTLSGNLGGAQSLLLESTCSENATATAGASFTNAGTITLTNGDSCANNATLAISAGTLTNSGKIATEPAIGGTRTLQGSITNKGTLAIKANTAYNGAGALLTNEGLVHLETLQLTVSNGGSFTNGAGGEIAASTGDVLMSSGTSFSEGAGTTNGAKPVVVDDGALSYTGSGKSLIALRGSDTLSGGLASEQSLSIESTCSENATATAGASFTNAGTITLTNSETCANNATLAVSAGTLTNSGKIATEPAIGGTRTLQGNLTNTGTLALRANTTYNGTGAALVNQGQINMSTGTVFSINGSPTVTNGAGGAIVGTGSGRLVQRGGTFDEGAGKVTGSEPIGDEFVVVDDGTLNYTGTVLEHGSGTIVLRGTSNLSGTVRSGEILVIESSCSENATATAAGSFLNAGTVELTNGETCANGATLNLKGGTLTNVSVIIVANPHGGTRAIQGNLANEQTLSLAAGATLQVSGNYTQASTGHLKTFIASASSFGSLSVAGSATIAGVLAPNQTSFEGSLKQKFTILTSSSLTGTFSKMGGEDKINQTGLYYQPTYSAKEATLVVAQATLSLSATSGPPSSPVAVGGGGYTPGDTITLTFTDHKGVVTVLASAPIDSSGEFSAEVAVPESAAVGQGSIKATSAETGVHLKEGFKVT